MLHRLLVQVKNNAVAYVALFVALSGSAFAAASTLPKNSVGTAQLKNRAVTGAKVARGTLTGANIKSSTLGIVPNAAHLGGLLPSAFQRAITHGCRGSSAIQTVSQRGTVTCQTFGRGTITGVIAGTGLTGGGRSGRVSLSVDPTVVQARVTDACAAGRAMSSIKADGTVGCHTSDVTQMMGGTGTATISAPSDFISPVGISNPSSQIQADEVGSAAAPSTARNLIVKVATAPASGASWTFTFYVNHQQQSGMQCVITGPASSCRANGSVSIPRGSKVALHESGSNAPAATTLTFGWTDTTF